jgi:glycosyltransferase involved in cell wall biosynthesis
VRTIAAQPAEQLNGMETPAPVGINTSPRELITFPVSVIVPVKNEARNLGACLESLRGAGEIFVIDSQSTDETVELAQSFGARVIQFHYHGGWPKKRQWALDSLPLRHEWVLLLDADESLTPELRAEIIQALRNPDVDGYYLGLQISFLGRELRHCGATFYKLSLFRCGKGEFECRTRRQDASMGDMEVHEHVLVDGAVRKLKHRLIHRNVETLSRYIQKHNEYSNWEAQVWSSPASGTELRPRLLGSQAERRRWLRQRFFLLAGSSLLLFLYRYVLRLGFLDGSPGLIYCAFQAIQSFHVKSKLYEMSTGRMITVSCGAEPQLKEANVRH